MQRTTLDLLVCPSCRGCLDYAGTDEKTLHVGILICSRCKKEYPIEDGIPHFIQSETLTGFNRRFARLYDWFACRIRVFSKVAHFNFCLHNDAIGGEITDRLEPH